MGEEPENIKIKVIGGRRVAIVGEGESARVIGIDIIWELLKARCVQLSESVIAARLPFLLVLTWSFIWFWALYIGEYGYADIYSKRWVSRLAVLSLYPDTDEALDICRNVLHGILPDIDSRDKLLSYRKHKEKGAVCRDGKSAGISVGDGDCSEQKAINNYKKDSCWMSEGTEFEETKPIKNIYNHGSPSCSSDDDSELSDLKKSYCLRLVNEKVNFGNQLKQQTETMAFPGGFSPMTVTDLGVLGQSGVLLILLWLLFASRRENHAVRSFVDINRETRDMGIWFPKEYILVPQRNNLPLTAEHFDYAYQSVAQRFIFIFSRHSRPLLITTLILLSIPSIVASWNFYTDLRDLNVNNPAWETAVGDHVIGETILLFFVLGVTYRILRHVSDTSILLNGWYLATRYVWGPEWNERNLKEPPLVRINVERQSAERYER